MIEIEAVVEVSGIRSKQVFDFMIECTDDSYQEWWPGTHFQFHTEKHVPGNIGNVVYFDEMIGKRRIRSHAVIKEVENNTRILWQLMYIIPLPVWVELKLHDKANSLELSHIMRAGFEGLGKPFDYLFQLIFNSKFELELSEHANQEFRLLAKLLSPHKT